VVFVCLVALAFQQSGLAVGDAWKTERSYRFLNEEPKIDFTNIERTDYRVDNVDAHGISLTQSRALYAQKQGEAAQTKPAGAPKASTLKFGPGGVPSYAEDPADLVQARVDRVQWSAAEQRAGVSWTRKFRAAGTLPGAKLTMKPMGGDANMRTIAVTYVEDGGAIKGEASVTVLIPKGIVSTIKMTLDGVLMPGNGQPVKVAINQKLLGSEGK